MLHTEYGKQTNYHLSLWANRQRKSTYVQDWTQVFLISTSYLAGIFDRIVCFGDFLPMRTLCDAYHKEFESHRHSILDISGEICQQLHNKKQDKLQPQDFQKVIWHLINFEFKFCSSCIFIYSPQLGRTRLKPWPNWPASCCNWTQVELV